jgi:hypothetical protein
MAAKLKGHLEKVHHPAMVGIREHQVQLPWIQGSQRRNPQVRALPEVAHQRLQQTALLPS